MAEGSIQEKRAKRREQRRRQRNTNKPTKVKQTNVEQSSATVVKEPNSGQGNAIVRGFNSVVDYFQGVRSEIEKVTWPTRDEAIRLTWIVTGVTIASALFLGGLSIIFTELFNIGVRQPIVFIGVFIAFLGLLYAYSWYIDRTTSE